MLYLRSTPTTEHKYFSDEFIVAETRLVATFWLFVYQLCYTVSAKESTHFPMRFYSETDSMIF